MDGIVFGLAQINFQQSLVEGTDENSAPNWIKESPTNMASSELYLLKSTQVTSNCVQDNKTLTSSSETTHGWEETEEAMGNISSKSRNRSRKSCTFLEKRQLPTRASKETSMLGIKRRTIMKPTKRSQAIHKDFSCLKPADIKKIYLNKKITNFRPSSLETIFEEPLPNQNCLEEHEHVRLIGARKIKRSLSCSDGLKHNKTLVNKRRAKIKKTFGKRFALKKISLEEFLDKLNSSMEEHEAASNRCDPLMVDEGNLDHKTSTPNNCDALATSEILSASLSLKDIFVTDSPIN